MNNGRPRLTRRAALFSGLAAAATAIAGEDVHGADFGRAESLGGLAAEKGLLFGASFAVHEAEKPDGARYSGLYAREVRSITSELELKLSSLRPTAAEISFEPADRLFDFAARTGLAVRGHTLVWNDDVPAWIRSLSPKEAGYLMDAHIETVLTRYRGRAIAWDVVNEPIAPWDHRPDHLRAGPFLAAYGEDYIARSFLRARRADPGAKLVLNEAFTETADERGDIFRRSLLALLRRLKDKATPIDAVGLQCHLSSRKAYDFPRFAAFVAEVAELGVDIHLTELDVDDSILPPAIPARDAAVAAIYRDFLGAVLPVTAIKSLTLWQLADHTSWLHYADAAKQSAGSATPRPLPFDAGFARKPAWTAIAAALKAMPPR
ncbi:MAG: endo-1,4-beta-xylanase [Hyphomicrobium sp.]